MAKWWRPWVEWVAGGPALQTDCFVCQWVTLTVTVTDQQRLWQRPRREWDKVLRRCHMHGHNSLPNPACLLGLSTLAQHSHAKKPLFPRVRFNFREVSKRRDSFFFRQKRGPVRWPLRCNSFWVLGGSSASGTPSTSRKGWYKYSRIFHIPSLWRTLKYHAFWDARRTIPLKQDA